MSISLIPSPDLSRLASGGATLLLMEGLGFSADGSRLLVKASFLDSADGTESPSRIHYGIWLFDLNSQQYVGNLNELLGFSLGSGRDIEVSDAKIVGNLNSNQIIAKYYIKNSNDVPALALLGDNVVVDFDLLASIAGVGAEVPVTRYAVSQDSRFLAVQTSSAVLAAPDVPDDNEVDDIYVIDLLSKTTTRVSMAGNAGGNSPAFLGNIFSNGSSLFVSFITGNSFSSQDSNSSAAAEASSDAYLWRSSFTLAGFFGKADLKVVSQSAGRATGFVDTSFGETIQTSLGTYFNSLSDAYYANDSNGSTDPLIMGADGVVRLVGIPNQKSLTTGATVLAASLDGKVVALLTHSPEISGSTGADKLVVLNAESGAISIVSEPLGVAADDSVISAVMSIDGKQFAFTSLATNLTQYDPPAAQGSLYVVVGPKSAPDIVAPTVATFSPTDKATGVAIGADIVVTFSEAVQRGTGNIVLKTSSGTVIATYDAASSTSLSISGSTLTINPTADLGYGTGYKVEFASGTIQDLAGNNYAGVSDYNFTTGIFDAAPTFANVPAAAVSHIAGQVFSLDDVTVADADSSKLSLTLNPSNGILLGLIDQDSTTAGTQISGTASAINKALASAMFVGTSAGAANIGMTLKDLANTSVANYLLTIAAPASSTDTDGDGVINSLEASDGNKDGIPDQYQANVASNATLTLVASSTQAIPPVDATTTISKFSNVSDLGTLNPPTGMTEPGGVLSFNALVSAGKEEHFSILVAASLGVNGYWQQNSNGAWVNMASAINGGSVTQVGDQTRLDFVITDGGAFDGDHIANGIIQDIGLIGHLTPGLVGMPIVLPDDGFWF